MTDLADVGLPDPTPYLLPEEKVRLIVRRHHPIVLVPVAALAALIIVGVVVALLSAPTAEMLAVGALIIVGTLLWVGYRWLRWNRTVLVVTNRRLFQLVALGIRRVNVLPVVRQSVVFRQSPIGRAAGYGRVQVQTPTGATLHDFNWLAEAARFRDAVTDVAA
ncbi:MAG TPA: PH domain-containing protein [Euzebyales bacterium]|nr:PH domain-containing protein [Euzebyales bacterium]